MWFRKRDELKANQRNQPPQKSINLKELKYWDKRKLKHTTRESERSGKKISKSIYGGWPYPQ